MKKYESKGEIAKRFSVSTTTVSSWQRRGCPVQRPTSRGGPLRFDPAQVRRWLKARADSDGNGSNGTSELTAARARKVHYQSLIAELHYREQVGELVRVDEVKQAAFQTCRRIRDAILQIPARISPIIAAERDPHKCRMLIDAECRKALENLADG